MGILAAATFALLSTYHRIKDKTPGQLVFGQYMILSIKHVENWGYIRHHKQAQIEKYSIRENSTIIDNDYRVVD